MKIITATFEIIVTIFLILFSTMIIFIAINDFNPPKRRFYCGEPVRVYSGLYPGNEGIVKNAYIERHIFGDKWCYYVDFYGEEGIKATFSIREEYLLKNER